MADRKQLTVTLARERLHWTAVYEASFAEAEGAAFLLGKQGQSRKVLVTGTGAALAKLLPDQAVEDWQGGLDFASLGALVHRLDPGNIPFRKATQCQIHVSGGEFNVAANLLQAQRDYFGAHTYERVDREGKFHTQWGQES